MNVLVSRLVNNMSQEETGRYLSLSKQRVSQIEKLAVEKIMRNVSRNERAKDLMSTGANLSHVFSVTDLVAH